MSKFTLQPTAIALLVGAQSVWSIPALAQSERLPDREMKRIIE
jgi:hypothetical protein